MWYSKQKKLNWNFVKSNGIDVDIFRFCIGKLVSPRVKKDSNCSSKQQQKRQWSEKSQNSAMTNMCLSLFLFDNFFFRF